MDEDCYPYVMTMSTSITPSSRHNSNIGSHRLHQQHTSTQSQQKQQQQQLQTQHIHTSAQSVCSSSSTNDNSSISSSDIDVDDSNVKDEPLSPSSSCPPSPSSSSASYGGGNVNLANMAAYTNTDLVFEHKVRQFLRFNIPYRLNIINIDAFNSIVSTEWFIAVVARLTKPPEKPTHRHWQFTASTTTEHSTTTDRHVQAKHQNGTTNIQ